MQTYMFIKCYFTTLVNIDLEILADIYGIIIYS